MCRWFFPTMNGQQLRAYRLLAKTGQICVSHRRTFASVGDLDMPIPCLPVHKHLRTFQKVMAMIQKWENTWSRFTCQQPVHQPIHIVVDIFVNLMHTESRAAVEASSLVALRPECLHKIYSSVVGHASFYLSKDV